jgi:hypothetical protein
LKYTEVGPQSTKFALKVKLTHEGAKYNLKMADHILGGTPDAWIYGAKDGSGF